MVVSCMAGEFVEVWKYFVTFIACIIFNNFQRFVDVSCDCGRGWVFSMSIIVHNGSVDIIKTIVSIILRDSVQE